MRKVSKLILTGAMLLSAPALMSATTKKSAMEDCHYEFIIYHVVTMGGGNGQETETKAVEITTRSFEAGEAHRAHGDYVTRRYVCN